MVAPIIRDEDLFRMALGSHESISFLWLTQQWKETLLNEQRLATIESKTKSNEVHLNSTETVLRLGALEGTLAEVAHLVAAIKTEVRTHIDVTSSSEHKRLQQLETENAMLKRDLAAAKEEIERKDSIVQGVRDTLSRRLIRTQLQNDMIKEEVREAIAQAKLDIEGMQRKLHSAIETAVLNYQNPNYATALRSLQDISEEARRKVLAQSVTLHTIIDGIGAKDPIEEIKTMHSNLPPLYRKQLSQFTKEQLLSIIDILSFEEGTVDVVGKALYAKDPNHTQSVFT